MLIKEPHSVQKHLVWERRAGGWDVAEKVIKRPSAGRYRTGMVSGRLLHLEKVNSTGFPAKVHFFFAKMIMFLVEDCITWKDVMMAVRGGATDSHLTLCKDRPLLPLPVCFWALGPSLMCFLPGESFPCGALYCIVNSFLPAKTAKFSLLKCFILPPLTEIICHTVLFPELPDITSHNNIVSECLILDFNKLFSPYSALLLARIT